MKKSILIGVSIVTVLGILLAAAALGFADTKTKFNAFADAKANEQATENTIDEAQAKVSFEILEPTYLPSGYILDNAKGSRFIGVINDLDAASLSYKNGDEMLDLKEIIIVKTKQKTEPSEKPKDTREIVDINGIEGRFSEENGIKFLNWKIGELSLSIMSWKNEGQNQTSSSLSKEEMIKMARSVK